MMKCSFTHSSFKLINVQYVATTDHGGILLFNLLPEKKMNQGQTKISERKLF